MSTVNDNRQPACNDVASEVTLVSQDKQEFKVKKYHLLSASSFFRDMLEAPGLSTGTGIDSTEPGKIVLELDIAAKTLEILIEFLHKEDVAGSHTWVDLRDVIDACDKWGLPIVIERVALRLRRHVEAAPWAIFCIAARVDDSELAKAALKHMKRDPLVGTSTVATLPAKAVAACPIPYYAGLVAASPTARYCPHCRGCKLDDDWTAISARFEPLRF